MLLKVNPFYSGFMVTVAKAYFHDGKLRGVAGVDILMADLLSEVQYFNQAGPKSYAFLFHAESGYTMSHPNLPTPEGITEDSNSVNILELEQGKEFKDLLEDVKRKRGLRYAQNGFCLKTASAWINNGQPRGNFHWRRSWSWSRSSKRTYDLVNFENQSLKLSHKLDGIGVGRIRPFLFFLLPTLSV